MNARPRPNRLWTNTALAEGKDQSFQAWNLSKDTALTQSKTAPKCRLLTCAFFSDKKNSLVTEERMSSKTMPFQVARVWWQDLRYEDLKDELLSLRWLTTMFFKWQWWRLRGCGAKAPAKTRIKSPWGCFPTW